MRKGGDAIGGKADGHRFSGHQGGILQGQGIVCLGQNADKIALSQRL